MKLSALGEKRLTKISSLGEYGELHKLEALSANFRPKKNVDSNLLPGEHGMVKKHLAAVSLNCSSVSLRKLAICSTCQ